MEFKTVKICSYFDTLWRNLCGLLLLTQLGDAIGKPKNILFIMADDLRPEIGAYINKKTSPPLNQHIYTPNIDKLAKKSIVFNKAYVQSPLCAPSRASLLTGRRPDTTDVHTFVSLSGSRGSNFTTLPQYFKQQGYTSIGMGKIFHFSNPKSWSRPFWPGISHHESIRNSWKAVPEKALKNKPLRDDQVADRAIKTIRGIAATRKTNKNNIKPFFLAVGFKKPHLPFVFPERFLRYYSKDDIVLPNNPHIPLKMPRIAWSPLKYLKKYGDLSHFKSAIPNDTVRDLRRAYYACATYVDYQVGRVMKELQKSGFSNDTIVVFLSDHGFHLGENGEWCKSTVFKLAAWAPLMIHIPGVTDRGIRTNQLVEFVDLFPTLVDAVGHKKIKICPEYSRKITLCTEGTSLLPLISKPNVPLKTAAFTQILRSSKLFGYAMITPNYRYTEWTYAKRQKDITRIKWNASIAKELYDHTKDPNENYNIVRNTSYTHIQKWLSKLLHLGWRKAVVVRTISENKNKIDTRKLESPIWTVEREMNKCKVNGTDKLRRAMLSGYHPIPKPVSFIETNSIIIYIIICVLLVSFLVFLWKRRNKNHNITLH